MRRYCFRSLQHLEAELQRVEDQLAVISVADFVEADRAQQARIYLEIQERYQPGGQRLKQTPEEKQQGYRP